jgi:hypothetical protein
MIPHKETDDADMEINFNDAPVTADEVELLKIKRTLLKKLAMRFEGAHKKTLTTNDE